MAKERLLPLRLWRAAFISAALFAVIMACLPQPPQLPGDPPDKAVHAFAFAVLAVLARASYPQSPSSKIFFLLGALGALIEGLQAIPAVGREPSVLDWLADLLAILAALGIIEILSPRWAKPDSKARIGLPPAVPPNDHA